MTDPSVHRLYEKVRSGDRLALGQAITLLESTRSDHRHAAGILIAALLPLSGRSIRVGVTGVPGVGKSTFIENLGVRLTTSKGRRVAVLAIDPTSPLSGGSILGDKTRMQRLAADPRAFIRPSPSGGAGGGVGSRTRDVMLLCEAAGYDVIFVETVGVGQAETTVRSMVDFFLLLTPVDVGDELQGIKRGVIEMADGIAVTKADGDRESAARSTWALLEPLLQLFPAASGRRPRIHVCSAHTGNGLDTVWDDILDYERFARESGFFEKRRQEQAGQAFRAMLNTRLIETLHADPSIAAALAKHEGRVMRGELGASAAAEAVLHAFLQGRGGTASR